MPVLREMGRRSLKRILRALILVACVAALAVIAAVRGYQASVSLLGAKLVDSEELAAITALPEVSSDGCVLHWNGQVLPYDTQQRAYCLSQPLDGEATGRLSSTWGSVYLPADQWADGWQETMAEGRRLSVYVSDGKRWCRLEVYLSGLPVLVLHTETSEPIQLDPAVVGQTMANLPLAYNYGSMTLFWPEGNTRVQIQSSGAEWHWRGNASLFAKKKSYRLNLLDEKLQDENLDLLGLGEENGWVLVNFSTDCTRVRDKVATDLWNELAAVSPHDPAGAEMEYVELYLDDTYLGVYGLCRSVSRKSMELSAQDVMYKWRQASRIDDATIDQLEEEQTTEWLNRVEIVWPNIGAEGLWEPLRSYVNTLHTEGADWQTIEATADVDNLIDMALFKQFICGVDNLIQNQYLIWRAEDGRFYRLPWDMNYSFGDAFDSYLQRDLAALALPDLELDALYAADPERTRQMVAERWKELRQTVFRLDHLEEMFRAETEVLTASGAWSRDYGLWGETDAYQGLSEHRSLTLEETLTFMESRLDFLDEYLADFTPADREGFDVLQK